MARLARVVVAGVPHHVTQRGNRRQPAFFGEQDYVAYLDLMAEWCAALGVEIWAYCLMPNHVHLIAVPKTADGLAKALGEAHRRYTRRVNLREDWRGHLWQGRFASFPLDRAHTLAAARYIELNPVQARLADRPEDYPWSSARAHLTGVDDRLARVGPLLDEIGDWRTFLSVPARKDEGEALRRHERTGRPLGDEGFLTQMETLVGRRLRRGKRGPKPRE
jgi:putative transposase